MNDQKINKVVLIPAYFEAIGKDKTVNVPTGETKKGFFGDKNVTKKETQWMQTGWSDCLIDSERLANDLAKVVEDLNNKGYEIVALWYFPWRYDICKTITYR